MKVTAEMKVKEFLDLGEHLLSVFQLAFAGI